MAAAEHDHYDLVGLGPNADGWRAIIGDAVVPVVAWGLVHRTRRASDGSVVKDLGRSMSGLVAQSSAVTAGGPAAWVAEFEVAESFPNLTGYLSPDMPDPHS